MITQLENVSDWTHKNVRVKDIRKNDSMYILCLDIPNLDNPIVTILSNIFEEQLKTYFITSLENITRADILNLQWNMVLTQGYFIKLNKDGFVAKKEYKIPNKWYVSFLKVRGELSTFDNIYK